MEKSNKTKAALNSSMAQEKIGVGVGINQSELKQHLADEKTRINHLGRMSQIQFGSLDGLLVPLGVVSGVAGGTADSKAVIVAGLAEAFAGALSMGAGEFISGKSEAQVQKAEVTAELERIHKNPNYELEEFVQILQEEGVRPDDAREIALRLQRNPKLMQKLWLKRSLE